MADIIFTEYLKSFGLTGQEAVIYEILLKNDAMTGYEIAKDSGISRSNVYGSLSGLVEKGAAYLIEGEPARYISVEITKFCDNMLRELGKQAEYLKTHAPQRVETNEGFVTVQGSRHIRDMISNMLNECQLRLYLMAEPSIIKEFEPQLKRLIQDGKKVVILTKGYSLDGAVMYETEPELHQIRFITDSARVLTGELKDTETDSCLYSAQKNLVSVMKEAIGNRIILIEKSYLELE